jgi:hypothetical protein
LFYDLPSHFFMTNHLNLITEDLKILHKIYFFSFDQIFVNSCAYFKDFLIWRTQFWAHKRRKQFSKPLDFRLWSFINFHALFLIFAILGFFYGNLCKFVRMLLDWMTHRVWESSGLTKLFLFISPLFMCVCEEIIKAWRKFIFLLIILGL